MLAQCLGIHNLDNLSVIKSMGRQIGVVIIATNIVQLANGFFGTLISLRVGIEKFEPAIAGFILSSYYAGFTAGAFFSGRIIDRFGHIRAYTAFGGSVVAAAAIMPLIIQPLPWLALLVIVGFG
jgi:MFS family permease